MRMILIWLLSAASAVADPMLIDDFSEGSQTRWQYVSDRVMGGVSDGRAGIGSEAGTRFAQLRGTVSTANNGGFIQIRRDIADDVPADAIGLQFKVRGNGADYFVHLRPANASRPWQYHQARFTATEDWQTVTLLWEAFTPNGGLPTGFAPEDLRSIGFVAYGADYEAALDVDWLATVTP